MSGIEQDAKCPSCHEHFSSCFCATKSGIIRASGVPSALSPGTRVGAYEILQRLGAGGMGEVYRARDTRLGREIALKTISMRLHSEAGAVARLEQEARSACALNHPNIVTIYELGAVGDTHYIAMELVSGRTLRELLSAGPIPFRKAVAIAAQIAGALAKAHEIGIVHRDLKPANLMVTSDGTAKVLDFGLAKLLATESTDAPLTTQGTVMGTVGYMSPEQANGRDVDFRSDQFSFGSVLYEMTTGLPAFQGRSCAEITAAILRDHPEPITSKLPQAPAPFVWIVERCLAKDPKQRYSSTHDLARDLAAVRDGLADVSARPVEARPRKLPVQRTTFVGREREATALRQLLSREEIRLATLTGPGGIGKTRLALQVAGELAHQYRGGVCFVPLSTVSQDELIGSAVAQALGVRESGKQSSAENLQEFLGDLSQPMLLVLDNFEHLVSGAPFVADLLSASPHLKIVVTSQAALHVYGEHEFPVPPLAVPDATSLPPLGELSLLPAVALFVERSRAVKQEFELTKENAPAVAAICARLDGLPLAIELAAARIKLISPTAMLARLESSLNLLTGGARDLPTRQQTLRGTVDWSFRLLNEAEQTLFRRLAVFVGGCTLEGVEAVCDTRGDLGIDVFNGIASMVDKSLVQQVEHAEGEARFVMLSTIRDYALERLAESGDEPATRRAHAAYYLVVAEEVSKEGEVPNEWQDVEHNNFRAALDYLIRTANAEWGLRLGSAMFRYWESREHLSEGREYIAKLLKLDGALAYPKLRSRVLFSGAVLAGVQRDYESAQRLFEDSLETCVEQDDKRGVAVALNALAVNARDRDEIDTSCLLFERCVAIWKDMDNASDTARALSNLASTVKMQGDYERASKLYDECLAVFQKAGDHEGIAWTLNYQGDVAREKNDYATARKFYEQSLTQFQQLQDGWGIASVLSDIASLSCNRGEYAEAQRRYGESIKLFQALDHKRGIARVLESLASSAASQSKAELSLRLAGAAAALRQRLGVPLGPTEKPKVDKTLETARQMLSGASGMSAWMEGWTMPVEQAVQEALSVECGPRTVGPEE